MAKLYEIDYKRIGERIKKIREERGKSIKDVAESLKCDERTVRNYESGQAVPLAKLLLLRNELECDMGYMLGEYDESNKDIAFICNETGLSEKTIEYLKETEKNRKLMETKINSEPLLCNERGMTSNDICISFLDYLIPRIDKIVDTILEIIGQNNSIEEYKKDEKKFALMMKLYRCMNEYYSVSNGFFQTVLHELILENNGKLPDALTDEHIVEVAEKIVDENLGGYSTEESPFELLKIHDEINKSDDWNTYKYSFKSLKQYDENYRKIQEFIISDTFLDIAKEYINNH